MPEPGKACRPRRPPMPSQATRSRYLVAAAGFAPYVEVVGAQDNGAADDYQEVDRFRIDQVADQHDDGQAQEVERHCHRRRCKFQRVGQAIMGRDSCQGDGAKRQHGRPCGQGNVAVMTCRYQAEYRLHQRHPEQDANDIRVADKLPGGNCRAGKSDRAEDGGQHARG